MSSSAAAIMTPTTSSIPEPVSNGTIEAPFPTRTKKLHGRAFYESIGSPKFILAPMVDQSEFAWRMLSRSFIPASSQQDLLAYTPMLHARLFSGTPKFRYNHFQPLRSPLASHPSSPAPETPQEDLYLDGNPKFDRPLFVQFCANDPEEFLAAAKYVTPYCDAVDLNLGCPQGIARKGKYGAFLQEDQQLIFNLIHKLHKELDVPITAKLRILETREKTLEYVQNVIKAGASIVTIHGRTRDMKGHKTGLADWKTIKWLREQIPREVVIFANGNILRKVDIDRCLEETGVDGVMSAEGNLYDPAIFATPPPVGEEGREYWRGKDGKGGWRMDAVFRRYMDIIYKHVMDVSPPARKPLYLPSDPPEPEVVASAEEEVSGEHQQKRARESGEADEQAPPAKKQKRERKEKTQNPNFLAMQPHLFHLLRALVGRHHGVRDALARCRAGDIAAYENVLQMVEAVVKDGLEEYERTEGRSWEEELAKIEKEQQDQKKDAEAAEEGDEKDESSLVTVRECKRPWWVVQPHVRPLPKEALAKGSWALSKKDKAKLEAEAVEAERKKKADVVKGIKGGDDLGQTVKS